MLKNGIIRYYLAYVSRIAIVSRCRDVAEESAGQCVTLGGDRAPARTLQGNSAVSPTSIAEYSIRLVSVNN